jgi:hypothetical protein
MNIILTYGGEVIYDPASCIELLDSDCLYCIFWLLNRPHVQSINPRRKSWRRVNLIDHFCQLFFYLSFQLIVNLLLIIFKNGRIGVLPTLRH